MTDHANELRRYSRKIGHPAGDVPSVMLAAADEIERLAARLEAWENVFGHLGTPDEVGNEWRALSDRLEAAESEAIEQSRLNGMGAEREAALLAKLEAAEKERDALRAKIAEMEQQAPARLVTATAYRWRYRGAVKWQYGELTEETARLAKEHNHEVQPLYALPGAKGEEK